jgi:hypothetical protein
MTVNISAASEFMATHARVLDRRRFQLLMGETDPAAVLAALDGYRNPDGGYGWGLEPDLRAPESQPAAALHAFEVFADVAPETGARAVPLCDWLRDAGLPDGGLPFTLPISTAAGTAPWWASADSTVSSLQITSVTAAIAHRVAVHDPGVAAHPWLETATRYCLAAIDAIDATPHAYVLAFAVRFLDAVHDAYPEAPGLLERLGRYIPDSGRIHVEGGTEHEMLRPLDFTPSPDRPTRALFDPEAVEDDLDHLAGMQQDDGGWTVDYAKVSPAGALEWRGYATVRAVEILRHNARI